MTTKRIVYTTVDGGMCVVTPAPQAKFPEESEDEFVARIVAKDIPPEASTVHICEATDISSDRRYRGAWEQGENKLPFVEMGKARDIHRNKIRQARTLEFAKNDIAAQNAILDNDSVAQAAAIEHRDALRDAPADPAINAASNSDELALVWPAGLTEVD